MARFNHDNLRKKISETSDTYRSRIRSELPQFPLDVIDHWLVEHGNALDHTDWLDLRSLMFTSEMWSTERVLSDLQHWNDAGVEEEHCKFTEQSDYRERYPLAVYVSEHGTWPVGIIVYHNVQKLPVQFNGGRSEYIAIEGTHRLGFLRGLFDLQPETLAPQHKIWVARGT